CPFPVILNCKISFVIQKIINYFKKGGRKVSEKYHYSGVIIENNNLKLVCKGTEFKKNEEDHIYIETDTPLQKGDVVHLKDKEDLYATHTYSYYMSKERPISFEIMGVHHFATWEIMGGGTAKYLKATQIKTTILLKLLHKI
ncbi:MAG: hypothetical protein ABIG87_01245, partial [Patescibacteria group bacterium]